MSHNLSIARAARAASLCASLFFLAPLAGSADAGAAEPAYALFIDAAAGYAFFFPSLDLEDPGTRAAWSLSANLLHRVQAPGWGFVLSHSIDLSGPGSASNAPLSPSVSVYEAYARLDAGDWGQVFIGKRRMGIGIGTSFSPGDAIDPRTGFWDQKNGFRGLGLSASLGSDLSLKAALGLDRSLDAWAAALRKNSAQAAAVDAAPGSAAINAAAAAASAWTAALDGAAGPLDPKLLRGALSADYQIGSLQLALSGVYSYDRIERPALGFSLDLGGLILQGEGAVELAGGPDWYGTGGLRYTFSSGDASLVLALDYDYNGAAGLLAKSHYLLPYLNATLIDVFSLYARALVGLEEPSALLSAGLTLYPAPGIDLELTGSFGLGAAASEFATLPGAPLPGSAAIRDAIGLAARVHF
jgi:hypothetical protein